MSKVKVGDRVAFHYNTSDSPDKKNLLGSGTVYKVEQVVNLFKESGSVIEVDIQIDKDLVSSAGQSQMIYNVTDVRVVSTH